ncbi:MAG TPA: tRNA (adenosine(37)-N6)-threonylcarbamoyltransferase complex dimerization subunit type 1 TsaB [Mesorhizobium sp.]|nr:tRNA (adenosine(37)-N6)-threonylcarbamoyltransferase complex dimerization subunit type 1 TsaB [Mesorhizobium sp.]
MTLVLAIDTAADRAAAAVLDASEGREPGRAVEVMATGHAERLMAVIAEALRQAGVGYADLGRIAVSVGPGSFTGVRVGVATGRGLALALSVPAVGVSTLEALAAEARSQTASAHPVLTALDGGRDTVFAAAFDEEGAVLREPTAVGLEEAVAWAREIRPILAGTAAARLAAALPDLALPVGPQAPTADIAVFALLGAAKSVHGKPKPLYLRPPDAKPQAGFILPRRA